jgi:hypothetical protein
VAVKKVPSADPVQIYFPDRRVDWLIQFAESEALTADNDAPAIGFVSVPSDEKPRRLGVRMVQLCALASFKASKSAR